MTYRCRHFKVEELVPPETFNALGETKCWWLLDAEGLEALDTLRDDLQRNGICGSLTVNNWVWDGDQKYSGYRPPECTIGAAYSQHRFGRAFDLKPNGTWDLELADGIRSHIRNHRARYPWITAMETGITWVHIDGRNATQFLEFAP